MPKFFRFLLFLLPFAGSARSLPDTLVWGTGALQWTHFKASYDTVRVNRRYHAVTAWRLYYTYGPAREATTLVCRVVAWFDASQSWVRKEDRGSLLLLQHERGHFDLAEVLARRFRKALTETPMDVHHYRDSVAAIFGRLLTAAYAQQKQYDTETIHGTHRAQQQLWEKKIAVTLQELSGYSQPAVGLTLRRRHP